MAAPLNAYLYDFFRHGVAQQIDNANGIRRGENWFLLNDFSMDLATIVISLTKFMKAEPTDVYVRATNGESSNDEGADKSSTESEEEEGSDSDESSDKPLKPAQ